MGELSLYAVGDLRPSKPDPESMFGLALPALKKADILFGQLETRLSEKGETQRQSDTYPATGLSPERVSGLTYAGFSVISPASNHLLDQGEQALLETIDTLTRNNIGVIGVGRNIDEARKPLIIEKNGSKIAFLGYCSVLPKGYEATVDRQCSDPMRASTFYEQVDWQPGTFPRILTFANKDNLAAMVDDIKKVRPLVDIVVMSIHWGVHFVPALIAMYQKEVAYAAIDAGVDLILGHHAHILKGIEVYKGKAIFYSLGNFVFPTFQGFKNTTVALYKVKKDPEYPEYDFPADSRKTIIAKCLILNKKIDRISFLPVLINGKAQPVVMSREDKGFEEVLSYMKEITLNQALNTEYQVDGNEVIVRTRGIQD